MITKAAIYTCDICKKQETISTESGTSDGWMDFLLDNIGEWKYKTIEPSQLCPACARKIKLAIATINGTKMDGGKG